jgi:hypothetical protein
MLGAILPLHDVRNLRCIDPERIDMARHPVAWRPHGERNCHFADENSTTSALKTSSLKTTSLGDERNPVTSKIPAGGARRDRTDDLLLAKQALSQLSYGPMSLAR